MKTELMKNSFYKVMGIVSLLLMVFVSSQALASSIRKEVITPTGNVPLKLHVFDCGHVLARDISIFNPSVDHGVQMEMSVPCYLIQHPNGTLMWDGGLPDSLAAKKDGEEFYNGKFRFSVPKTLISQLNEIGVDPLEIDYLALSHLHADHSGNANYFTKSTWLIQKTEYDVAFSKNARNYGFVPENYDKLKDNKAVLLKGDYDVFGDGSVVIIFAPGHSPGHQVLFVDLPQTGPIILSGDLYHFQKNRENYGIPIWNTKKESVHSFVSIDNLLEQTQADLWIAHDKVQFDQQKHSPEFYQ